MFSSPYSKVSLVLEKAGHSQEKGIWGSLSSLAKSERISRALPGVSKNSSLAICFSSSFSISLLPSLSLLFSFSLLVLPSPECLSHCPDSSSQRLTWRPSMPRGRLIFLQPSPGLGYLGLECPFCQYAPALLFASSRPSKLYLQLKTGVSGIWKLLAF